MARNPTRSWTSQELDILRTKYRTETVEQIQQNYLQHRSCDSIRGALARYGLTQPRTVHTESSSKPWSEDEDNILRTYGRELTTKDIHQKYLPERSISAIRNRMHKLSIVRNPNAKPPGSKNKKSANTNWSKDELDTLAQHASEMPPNELHEKYLPNKTPQQIRARIQNSGLTAHANNNVWSDDEITKLRTSAPNHTLKELEILFPNRTAYAITSMCKRQRIKINQITAQA